MYATPLSPDNRMLPKELMTTKEVAEYLRIKHRKVYELISEQRIPCSRVAGKWLFPKALIDLWVLQNSAGLGDLKGVMAPPPIIAGSHDPLLEWCVRESGCELATMLNGSLDGVQRFVQGAAQCCGMHVFDPATGDYNRPLAQQSFAGHEVVLIEWAWRQQGLIVAAGNPHQIRGIADIPAASLRLIARQEGAGSRLLFQHLLHEQQIDPQSLHFITPPVRSETELALAIRDGKADAGCGIAAVAHQFQVEFVPLHRERYDIAIRRRDYFEPSFQRLLAFAHTPQFVEKASELTGYDISNLGRVIYNSP